MDQINQSQQSAPVQGLITEEQKKNLFDELGLSALPEDRKASLANKMIDSVLLRVFNRISPVLTDEDIKQITDLDQKDPSGMVLNQFLAAKVPNLNQIVMEETEAFKVEMKASIDAITTQMPK